MLCRCAPSSSCPENINENILILTGTHPRSSDPRSRENGDLIVKGCWLIIHSLVTPNKLKDCCKGLKLFKAKVISSIWIRIFLSDHKTQNKKQKGSLI